MTVEQLIPPLLQVAQQCTGAHIACRSGLHIQPSGQLAILGQAASLDLIFSSSIIVVNFPSGTGGGVIPGYIGDRPRIDVFEGDQQDIRIQRRQRVLYKLAIFSHSAV